MSRISQGFLKISLGFQRILTKAIYGNSPTYELLQSSEQVFFVTTIRQVANRLPHPHCDIIQPTPHPVRMCRCGDLWSHMAEQDLGASKQSFFLSFLHVCIYVSCRMSISCICFLLFYFRLRYLITL